MSLKQGSRFSLSATIDSSGSPYETEAIQLEGGSLMGVAVLDTIVGTELSFEVGLTPDALYPLKDAEGNAVTITLSGDGDVYSVDPVFTAPYGYIKVVSNGTETSDVELELFLYRV